MPALDPVIQAVVVLLQSVTGIGKVTAYMRYTPEQKDQISTYVDSGILNAWVVTREATSAVDLGAGVHNVRNKHRIAIHGYRAVTASTDSEQLHQELADAVINELNSNRDLADPSNTRVGWLVAPVQLETFNAVMMFGAVLCWHVKLTVIAEDPRRIT